MTSLMGDINIGDGGGGGGNIGDDLNKFNYSCMDRHYLKEYNALSMSKLTDLTK